MTRFVHYDDNWPARGAAFRPQAPYAEEQVSVGPPGDNGTALASATQTGECCIGFDARLDRAPGNEEDSAEDEFSSNEAECAKPVPPTQKKSVPRRLFLHDVALTMGAEAATVISSLLLTSLLSRWMGARALSEYLLLRRVLSWMLSGTLLGLATGLPRYVAYAGHRRRDEAEYFLAASICVVSSAIAVAGSMVIYRRVFAGWLFGNVRATGLVMALAMMLLGFAIHRTVYGFYRGLLDMKRANLLEVCSASLLPLLVVVLLFNRQPIGAMIFITGTLTAVAGALFAVPVLRQFSLRSSVRRLWARCKELLQYGVPRVPGEFGSAALTALGPMLAVHYMKIAQVSPLLLGLNMLMVTGYAAAPLGTVLLSKVSMMLGKNQHDELQTRLRLLVAAVMEVSVFTCIQLAVFADVVVRAWVGSEYLDQMGVIRLVLLAIPPYLFFVALRSTIDAATVKPFNTANVMISLVVYLGLIAGWGALFHGQSLLIGIAGSLLGSQVLLALLTVRTFRNFYGVGIPWRRLTPSFAAALALGAAALAFRSFLRDPLSLPEAILVESVLTMVYLALLAKRGSGWISYTWNVGVRGRADWPINAAQP